MKNLDKLKIGLKKVIDTKELVNLNGGYGSGGYSGDVDPSFR
jgi:hypothetical protein